MSERLVPLVRAEVQALAAAPRMYAVDHNGNYPDPHVPLAKSLENYYEFDPRRVDTEGNYLDPWRRPYHYRRRPRDGKAGVELYSLGPNGEHENGQGDDIASWRAKE